MKSFHIVEEEVFGQAITSLRDRLVVMEIDFLVLDRPPETLNKNIVGVQKECKRRDVHL